MRKFFTSLGLFSALVWTGVLSAQALDKTAYQSILSQFFSTRYEELGVQAVDLQEIEITDVVPAGRGAKHVYVHVRQMHGGIPLHNATGNFTISERGEVLGLAHRFQGNLAARIKGNPASLSAEDAIRSAARQLNLGEPQGLRLSEEEREAQPGQLWFSPAGIALSDIPVRLMYEQGQDEYWYLCWDLSVEVLSGKDWWSLRLNAETGEILSQINWARSCAFHGHAFAHCANLHDFPRPMDDEEDFTPVPASYRVFPVPVESPAHGNRVLLPNPSNNLASPYGWHDTNGATGAEFTITRGNNVYAYEDTTGNNQAGFSPSGGAGLVFDFPLDMSIHPRNSLSAAVTNLFYMNNIMHDIWYQYGFNEASGNFQQNNYGRGGTANDNVLAEAQDGGGTNNANFATPGDGSRPRMQMYLWTGSSTGSLEVNSPTTIAGFYGAVEATFGPRLTTPRTGNVVAALDGTAPTTDACQALTNAAALSGNIALIDRGTCNFIDKVNRAQQAGAIAVIMINNDGTAPFAMGGTGTVNIPSVMISQVDGQALRAALAGGATVNVTLRGGSNVARDGDFDNGIVAHEYGHGISNRLTGGRTNSNCLNNDEQMGEGWSDWFGLMLSIRPGDGPTTFRGYGTYAAGQPINGTGIRPAPYTTDMNVNNATYGLTNNSSLSRPHGIGFVWASMLWDMTWALIDRYGYDNDLYTGTGGNNIAMQLVIEGLKLQPCNPGFVDGRDAILRADSLLYAGANQCLIWEVFARRGLGFSASQGSAASRSDQVEAFDLAPICQVPAGPPSAAIANTDLSTCTGWFLFQDNSTSTPQQWLWQFGDGNSSTQRNPIHQYSQPGTYQVRLRVSNGAGVDSTTVTVVYQLPSAPQTTLPNPLFVCAGDSLELQATASGTIRWYDAAGNLQGQGNVFQTPAINAPTSFGFENAILSSSRFVGPTNFNFGTGGIHTGVFTGTVNFTASQPLDIVSTLVNSGFDSVRTISLWDGLDGTGNLLAQIQVNIPNGTSRVPLNIRVPAPGTYSLGATGANLYRNNQGAAYPYTIPGLISLTGSSAGSDFYYYFYDLEVQPASCASNRQTLNVQLSTPSFSFSANGNAFSFNNTSTGFSGNPTWDFGDGTTGSGPNPNHTYAQPGTYTVRLSLGNCFVEQQVQVTVSGLNQAQTTLGAYVYPQGAAQGTQLIFLQALEAETELQILDLGGRLIRQSRLPIGIKASDLPQDLPAGSYFLRLQQSGQSASLQWLKGE